MDRRVTRINPHDHLRSHYILVPYLIVYSKVDPVSVSSYSHHSAASTILTTIHVTVILTSIPAPQVSSE